MKVKELPSICSTYRLGLTLAIVFMVISTPVVMIVNPVLKAAPSTTDDYTSLSPSTIGQDGSDFTAQAPLTGVSARQTNNIVGVQSYYDVVFTTSTTGTIKFIDITFPAGTLIGAAPNLVEREGIGAGTAAKTSATVIRYTVTSAVSVPAGTQIRLEFFNIVNPTSPSTGYKVTVTTRNAAGTAIDGPTLSNSLNIKQVGTEQIADGAVTSGDVAPSFIRSKILSDGQNGWVPDGSALTFFTISDPSITAADSHVFISILEPFAGITICSVNGILSGAFQIACSQPPSDDSQLTYTVVDQPST